MLDVVSSHGEPPATVTWSDRMKLQSTAARDHTGDFGFNITYADLAARAQANVCDDLNTLWSRSQRVLQDAFARNPPAVLRTKRRRDSKPMSSLRRCGTGLQTVP